MKKPLSALLLFLTMAFPAALFAQSDGSVEPPPETPAEEPLPAEEPPVSEPAPAPEPEPAPQPGPTPEPAPSATTSAPAPVTAPEPAPSAPTVTAEPAVPESETSEPIPLEEAQEILEAVADEAPAPLQPWLAALAGALGGVIALLGIQGAAKKIKSRGRTACERCGGSGHASDGVCATCKGAKTIEEEEEKTLECPNCDAEGETDCARCEGEGGTDATSCSACKGEGAVDCSACLGQGEASVTIKRAATCPDCTP